MLKKICLIAFTLLCLLVPATVSAETAPRWITKGVAELDKERSNESYRFHVFHTYDPDQKIIELNRLNPVLDYVAKTYGVSRSDMNLDTLSENEEDKFAVHAVSFLLNGKESVVYAQLVDDYVKFEDFADGEFEYNLYQLYAITEANKEPAFDDFKVTNKYYGVPTVLSVVPGLGQLYKGNKIKGFTIMGSEVLLVSGAIVSNIEMKKFEKISEDYSGIIHESYQSQARTFRQFRNFCVITGAGLYIYNILDATFAKGVRYVKVKPKNSPNASMELALEPVVSPDMAGCGIKVRF